MTFPQRSSKLDLFAFMFFSRKDVFPRYQKNGDGIRKGHAFVYEAYWGTVEGRRLPRFFSDLAKAISSPVRMSWSNPI